MALTTHPFHVWEDDEYVHISHPQGGEVDGISVDRDSFEEIAVIYIARMMAFGGLPEAISRAAAEHGENIEVDPLLDLLGRRTSADVVDRITEAFGAVKAADAGLG